MLEQDFRSLIRKVLDLEPSAVRHEARLRGLTQALLYNRNGETIMSENEDRSPNPHSPLPDDHDKRLACAAPDEAAECPQCAERMRLWASFYRCPNCGYKESCCF